MCGKTYTLEVSETELARVMFIMGKVNGDTEGESVYSQAHDIFGFSYNRGGEVYHVLHKSLGTDCIDYRGVQEEWEKSLGISKFKKSPVQQRIENLEKELDELKKLL